MAWDLERAQSTVIPPTMDRVQYREGARCDDLLHHRPRTSPGARLPSVTLQARRLPRLRRGSIMEPDWRPLCFRSRLQGSAARQDRGSRATPSSPISATSRLISTAVSAQQTFRCPTLLPHSLITPPGACWAQRPSRQVIVAQLLFGRIGQGDATVDPQVGVDVHQLPRRKQLPVVVVHRLAGEHRRGIRRQARRVRALMRSLRMRPPVVDVAAVKQIQAHGFRDSAAACRSRCSAGC